MKTEQLCRAWRWKVSFMYGHVYPRCPHSFDELHYNNNNSCQQFSAKIYSAQALTSNWFWVGPQAPQHFIHPFVYQPACTTLGLTNAHNQTNRVSGVDDTSLWGAYLGVLSDTPTECVTQYVQHPIPEMNTTHHACTKLDTQKQTWYHLAPKLCHKTVRDMSSLNFFSFLKAFISC